MEDENWDDDAPSTGFSSVDEGKSYGKGRGFGNPCGDNQTTNGFGGSNGYNSYGGYGHGGGRGGSERGGRGGGRGGFNRRNNDDDTDNRFGDNRRNRYVNDNDDDDDNDNNDSSYKPRGGGRGGGRGGRGGFNGRNNSNYDNGGGFGGGRNNRFNNDDNDDGNYKPRGGRTGGRGGGSGGFGKHNDNEDGGKSQIEKPKENYIPPEPLIEDDFSKCGISMGINFDNYESIPVNVTGENAPNPIQTFEEAGLRSIVLDNIRKSSYTKPTPVQKHAIPIIMSGRDLISCAQTGSGKTAAFLVPIISKLISDPIDLISNGCEPQVLVVSPTRELAVQIYTEALKFANSSIITCRRIYGGTNTLDQISRISGGCHILVATPGRLMDFVGRRRIKFSSIRYLVLDEADRMLDQGFLPDLEKILDHETMVPTGKRQTLMFSATFPEAVQRLAIRFLHNYLFLAVGFVGGACSDVEQNFYQVFRTQKKDKLKELLERANATDKQNRTIVFVDMKRTADFVAAFLSESNFPATSIHGDRFQSQREQAIEDFESGRMPILVATDVAARGLDIKGVTHVVNYDMPKDINDYVHRIGRTGRVGNLGKATTFFDIETDSQITKDLVRILRQASQPVPDWLDDSCSTSSFIPGRSKFGGKDFRKFDSNEQYSGGDVELHVAASAEPEEEW